jgi:hypothetical protein
VLANSAVRRDHDSLAKEARLSDIEPIQFPRSRSQAAHGSEYTTQEARISFSRQELRAILEVYGRMVAAGEWRDYAIDHLRDSAIFSVFRRASEMPLYRIVKNPKLARKQGAYSILTPTGLILKRGSDLARVLDSIERKLRPVAS